MSLFNQLKDEIARLDFLVSDLPEFLLAESGIEGEFFLFIKGERGIKIEGDYIDIMDYLSLYLPLRD